MLKRRVAAWVLVAAAGICLLLNAAPALAQAVDAFDPGTLGFINAIALQPDGKILLGGTFTTIGGGGTGSVARNHIARLLPDGSIDPAFNPGASWTVRAIAVQRDGKIVVGGSFTGLGGGTGTTQRLGIGRLNPDGSVDAAFNPGAIVSGQDAIVHAIHILQNGQILIGGMFTGVGGGTGNTTRRGIALLNEDGTLDATFNPGTSKGGVAGVVFAFAEQGDGAILVGGEFSGIGGGTGTTPRLNLARIDQVGVVDPVFNPGVSHSVVTLTVQADQRILVGGNFVGIGGGTGATERRMLARLESDGTVQASFNPFPVQVANSGIASVALQADGRIVVAGSFVRMQPGFDNQGIGRLHTDGSIDTTFVGAAPGGSVNALAIQTDGRIIVGGGFTSLTGTTGNIARWSVGRFVNTATPTDRIIVTGDSTVTWSRGGSASEVDRVEFALSTDGVTYSDLGAASRVTGGWQLTGLALPSDPNLRIRARGFHASGVLQGSGSIAQSIGPRSSSETVENGTFAGNTTNWLTFALPDPSGMNAQVSGGVFEFNRTGTQAVVFQQTGLGLPAFSPIVASFRLGNSDTVRKRISVLVHDSDFTDLHVCTFWLPGNLPLTNYSLQTHTTKAWSNLTVSFYAATGGSGGYYQLDDVSVVYEPSGGVEVTSCIDPLAPGAASEPPDPDVIVNGGFDSGLAPWTTFGQIDSQVSGGVFEFVKLAGTPAGVVLQATGQAVAAGQILTASFQLGNSSGVRKRVTVLVHDLDFSDLSACTFWLAPGQALSTYSYRTFTTKAWTNATISVYPATVGSEQWMRLDNVVLQRTPGSVTTGTLCVEPGGALPAAPPNGHSSTLAMAGPSAQLSRVRHLLEDHNVGLSLGPHDADVGEGVGVIELPESIDLTEPASSAVLKLNSWVVGTGAHGSIQVSMDGTIWEVVAVATPSDTFVSIEVDLSAHVGERVFLRFVLDSGGIRGEDQSWKVEHVRIDIDP